MSNGYQINEKDIDGVLNYLKMNKRILLYFVIFGFVLGIINSLEDKFNITGGDTPKSLILNQPALFIWQQIYKIGEVRSRQYVTNEPMPIKDPISLQERPAGSEPHNRYAPETQERALSKNNARNDWLIGQRGIITWMSLNSGKVIPYKLNR